MRGWRAREDHPFGRFGYPRIEAEDPIECPNCAVLFDARFWGRADIEFMDREETYREEFGLVCPDCKRLYPVAELLEAQ